MLRTRNITLSGTAQEITIEDNINTPNTISIQNSGLSGTAYIGGSNVTTNIYGIKLTSGQIFSADLAAFDQLYAIGDATISVLILER